MTAFTINFLDHVAIYVKDMETSIAWYSKVMGLKKYQLEAWGEFPVSCSQVSLALLFFRLTWTMMLSINHHESSG